MFDRFGAGVRFGRVIHSCGDSRHLLGDGANVCPGTPLASFEAAMQAAEEYGTGGGALPAATEGGTRA